MKEFKKAVSYGFAFSSIICVILAGIIIAQPLTFWKMVAGTQIALWMAVGFMWIAVKLKNL